VKGLIIAGTSSGSGKTMATLVVLQALIEMGEDPQPAKIGPDFIDPSHHKIVTEKASRTLDLWLQGNDGVLENYGRGEGTICVAEGVMGLYDGELSSTAIVAETLDLPVVLVIDGSAGMESVSATALGFKEYSGYLEMNIDLVGIIAQKVNSKKHEKGIRNSLPDGIEYLGRIPFMDSLTVPERHLGLFMGQESPIDRGLLSAAAEYIHTDRLVELAREPRIEIPSGSRAGFSTEKRIAVARDRAFNFLYPAALEALEHGAMVETFSPLAGDIPEDVDGIYLPGGYPELYLEELAASPTLDYLHQQASADLPVFGECGGMMVMSQALVSTEGKSYEMAKILPARVEMVDSLQGLGYTEVKIIADTTIGRKGQMLRGHEFHYSRLIPESDVRYGLEMDRGKGITGKHDGLIQNNAIGTYSHFHGASGLFNYFIENL